MLAHLCIDGAGNDVAWGQLGARVMARHKALTWLSVDARQAQERPFTAQRFRNQPDGSPVKAVQTGGPSGGCIPAAHFDTPVDY